MQNKKLIVILLIGAGAILLFMAAILLTNQYRSASFQANSGATDTQQQSEVNNPPADMVGMNLTTYSPVPSNTNTPENTIMQYFAYWNANDAQAMNTLWIPEESGVELYDMTFILRIDDINPHVQPAESIPQELASRFASMYDRAFALVDYKVYYNKAGQAEYLQAESTISGLPFLLVQRNPGDAWLIASLGY